MAIEFNSTIQSPDATSYIDVVEADQHHENFGNDLWATLTQDEKQVNLNRATAYVDQRFGPFFKGRKTSKSQALEWPRISAFDDDGFALAGNDDIPRQLRKAIAEYAMRAYEHKVLAPDPIRNVPSQQFDTNDARPAVQAGGIITQEAQKVGPISRSASYRDASQVNNGALSRGPQSNMVSSIYIPEYPQADMWLEDLMESSTSIDLVRA